MVTCVPGYASCTGYSLRVKTSYKSEKCRSLKETEMYTALFCFRCSILVHSFKKTKSSHRIQYCTVGVTSPSPPNPVKIQFVLIWN